MFPAPGRATKILQGEDVRKRETYRALAAAAARRAGLAARDNIVTEDWGRRERASANGGPIDRDIRIN